MDLSDRYSELIRYREITNPQRVSSRDSYRGYHGYHGYYAMVTMVITYLVSLTLTLT